MRMEDLLSVDESKEKRALEKDPPEMRSLVKESFEGLRRRKPVVDCKVEYDIPSKPRVDYTRVLLAIVCGSIFLFTFYVLFQGALRFYYAPGLSLVKLATAWRRGLGYDKVANKKDQVISILIGIKDAGGQAVSSVVKEINIPLSQYLDAYGLTPSTA